MFELKVKPYGDLAIHVQFGETIDEETFGKVQRFCEKLKLTEDSRIVEYVPTYHSVTLYYHPKATYKEIITLILNINRENLTDGTVETGTKIKLVEIPVCYGGEFGEDLEYLAEFHNLSPDEVIGRHTRPQYLVYAVGAMPGFGYLGGLDPSLATPRRSNPRVLVPKGSVAIGGEQTGVYPIDAPGGWWLIGRTPLEMFNSKQVPPTLLRSGDRVRFVSISPEEYRRFERKAK
ncbi:MAG: 5-oxoprolinase subunit PxpB [Desulfitobacteriaceae bacterium]